MPRLPRFVATTSLAAILTLGLATLPARADATLRITEVMSNGDTGSRDWFELSNIGTAPIDISGYKMDDNSFSWLSSVALNGISTIQPGEAVIFLETSDTDHLDIFRTTWSLDSSVQVGYYSGGGVSLSSGGDGVTIFDSLSNELPGPFTASELIRVSFGASTSGTTFYWTYNSDGASTSLSTGTLTTNLPDGTYTTWTNGSTVMNGTPGVFQSSSTPLLNWKEGSGTWTNGGGSDWRSGVIPTEWTDDSIAIFGGTPGTIEVVEDVTAPQLLFNTSGYTLTGDGLVETSSVSAPGGITTLDVEITGSQGLTIASDGIVALSRENSFSGDATVVSGRVQAEVNDVFDDSVQLAVARLATMDFNNQSDTLGGIKGLGTIEDFSSLTVSITGDTDVRFDGFLLGDGDFIVDSPGTGRQVFNTTAQTLADLAYKGYFGKTIIRQGALAINETAFPFLSEAIEIETNGRLILTTNSGVYIADNPIVFLGGALSQEAGENINEILNPLEIPEGQSGTIALINDVSPDPLAPTVESIYFSGLLSGGGNLHLTTSNPLADRGLVSFGTGNHSFSGTFIVHSGVEMHLLGNASAAAVQIESGAVLGGSGRMGHLSGSGLVAPGASPGILTASSLSPESLDFAFEFTQTGVPDFSNALASGNDILRLTHPDLPFETAFSSLNAIEIFLSVTEIFLGDEFQGGFFTDRVEDFLSLLAAAEIRFYVLGDGNGAHFYNEQSYYTLDEYNALENASWQFNTQTLTVLGANFLGGSTDGRILAFTAIPEPGTAALLVCTLGAAVLLRRRKK